MVELSGYGKKKRMQARRKELKSAKSRGEPVGQPKDASEFARSLSPVERLKAVREPTHWPYLFRVPATKAFYLDVPGRDVFSSVFLSAVVREIERRTGISAPKDPHQKLGEATWGRFRNALRTDTEPTTSTR
jgi:hypothetical protein